MSKEAAKNICNGLIYLHCEVLMVEDQRRPGWLHPRISIYQSHSFNELYSDQKEVLMRIYNEYFYRRHTQFWRDSAMRKLPTLIGEVRTPGRRSISVCLHHRYARHESASRVVGRRPRGNATVLQ